MLHAETPVPGTRYDEDVVRWAEEQAAALRAGRWSQLDVAHLADEIEDVSRSVRRELRARLVTALAHLLKRAHQPERASRSWSLTIREQVIHVNELLREAPSLQPGLGEAIERAYRLARIRAARETGLPLETFPLLMTDVLRGELHAALAADD
jgi:hypothetical protein